jgi:WD40 repeat protein
VWNLEGKQIEKVEEAHDRSIYSISWAKDKIITAGADNKICVFKVNEGMKLELVSSMEEAHS